MHPGLILASKQAMPEGADPPEAKCLGGLLCKLVVALTMPARGIPRLSCRKGLPEGERRRSGDTLPYRKSRISPKA